MNAMQEGKQERQEVREMKKSESMNKNIWYIYKISKST